MSSGRVDVVLHDHKFISRTFGCAVVFVDLVRFVAGAWGWSCVARSQRGQQAHGMGGAPGTMGSYPTLGQHMKSVATTDVPYRLVDEVGAQIATALAVAVFKGLVRLLARGSHLFVFCEEPLAVSISRMQSRPACGRLARFEREWNSPQMVLSLSRPRAEILSYSLPLHPPCISDPRDHGVPQLQTSGEGDLQRRGGLRRSEGGNPAGARGELAVLDPCFCHAGNLRGTSGWIFLDWFVGVL